MENPKQIAIDFIKPYVLRGDSLESLMNGQGGCYCEDFEIQINGNVWQNNKLVYEGKRDEIVVSKIGKRNCLHVFKLKKLYDEIKSGQIKLI